MSLQLKDTIQREIHLKAPLGKVWNALSEPGGITKWFCDRIDGSLEPGSHAVFSWGQHSVNVLIVTVETEHEFAYRWRPGSMGTTGEITESEPTTLVRFLLEEEPEGTKLTMIESGFASLPENYFEAFDENTQGWEEELLKLVKLLGGELVPCPN